MGLRNMMLLQDKMNKKTFYLIDCFHISETVLPKMQKIVEIYAVPGAQEAKLTYKAVSGDYR